MKNDDATNEEAYEQAKDIISRIESGFNIETKIVNGHVIAWRRERKKA